MYQLAPVPAFETAEKGVKEGGRQANMRVVGVQGALADEAQNAQELEQGQDAGDEHQHDHHPVVGGCVAGLL